MNEEPKSLRDRLLAKPAPQPSKLEAYRKEVEAMIEEKERRLQREKTVSGLMWLFVVALATTFLLIGGFRGGEIRLWFGIQACFWFLFGAVFLLRTFLNRNRVEFLKEIRGLEVRVLELQEKLGKG